MTSTIKQEVVINHVPGEECRIAVLEDGRLEEFYAEREDHNLHVGNIYLGRVANVEAAIQAAFVDFGIGHNGFLHISDLHPKFFPGESGSTTEAVGRKTPHRQRPPIQHCLKRGQEIAVQVIKEGIGTKGPTLTSYLSIPGRYLVMMPHMERLGVSRRVEEIEQRREMRQALDSLELPEGFGFILRTAGLNRTKTELKRDLAYLQRLWKTLEKKQRTCTVPCELYRESDLLTRTIRDVLTSNVQRILIDDAGALQRVGDFMRIVAPRSRTTLLEAYKGSAPIFHAMGIEDQLRAIHAREVPLPGGGSLVIDSTEAMVAIDVNSGRIRQFADAETMAFRVNQMAVDEICRQLRLRDLGGLIVLDLIDMRHSSHRREIENRLHENLKRDRAKTQFLKISQFGIIEMTRQRMRPGVRKTYFMDCPACGGRGQIRTPEATSDEAIRDLAHLLQHDELDRVEMVVSPAVAGSLLSRKRRAIGTMEDTTGKKIDIRVSKALSVDRFDLYAYNEHGADIDLKRLRSDQGSRADTPTSATADGKRQSGERKPDSPRAAEASESAVTVPSGQASGRPAEPGAEGPAGGKKKKKRRRRSRRTRDRQEDAPDSASDRQDSQAKELTSGSRGPSSSPVPSPAARGEHPGEPQSHQADGSTPTRTAPRRTVESTSDGSAADSPATESSTKRKKRRRRPRRSRSAGSTDSSQVDAAAPTDHDNLQPRHQQSTVSDESAADSSSVSNYGSQRPPADEPAGPSASKRSTSGEKTRSKTSTSRSRSPRGTRRKRPAGREGKERIDGDSHSGESLATGDDRHLATDSPAEIVEGKSRAIVASVAPLMDDQSAVVGQDGKAAANGETRSTRKPSTTRTRRKKRQTKASKPKTATASTQPKGSTERPATVARAQRATTGAAAAAAPATAAAAGGGRSSSTGSESSPPEARVPPPPPPPPPAETSGDTSNEAGEGGGEVKTRSRLYQSRRRVHPNR